MRCNQNDTSTFSFKELLEMKEKKPVELMPPPRAPIRANKDIIQELKKNLTETPSNAIQNQQLKEELNKIKLMNRESTYNYSFLSSNNINNIFNSINNNNSNNNINNNESEILLNDLDTFINNNSHNEINLDEENFLNTSLDTGKEKENFVKYNKLPTPKNKSEIKIFVNNLISYINFLIGCPSKKIANSNNFNDDLLIFKYKLETRYNDYKNHGLNEQYFINKLNQSQEDLINKLKESIKIDKKDENSNVNSLNIKNIINIHSNYFFMGKKRKKSLSEIKSITDGSSSYEGDCH